MKYLDREEWNVAICSNMDGLGGYYAKWNKTEKDQRCMISCIRRIEELQQTSEYNKKQPTHRYREQTSGYQRGEGGQRGKIGVGIKRYKPLCITGYKDMFHSTGNIVNFLNHYKWSITFKTYESLYYTPVPYIILHINCTSIHFFKKRNPQDVLCWIRVCQPLSSRHLWPGALKALWRGSYLFRHQRPEGGGFAREPSWACRRRAGTEHRLPEDGRNEGSLGCHNDLPQTGCFKPTDIYCLTDLEARSPKSRCRQGLVPSGNSEGQMNPCFLLAPCGCQQPLPFLVWNTQHFSLYLWLHVSFPGFSSVSFLV